MSGFSAEWLALREPADHRARNVVLRDQMSDLLRATSRLNGERVRILDLGCGTGSNLRALAAFLPQRQHWTLVDYDAALLSQARATLSAWADVVSCDGDGLAIEKSGKYIDITFARRDLAAGIEEVLADPWDLVTAAAFFDLVSPDWIARFCNALQAPLYTVLTYDGVERWMPPHRADQIVLDAFHLHQVTDKGFGPAAGPAAIALMNTALTARGFQLSLAQSPWKLGHATQALMRALSSGAAAAVAQTDTVSTDVLDSWLVARKAATSCEIGHWDLLAIMGN